MATNTSNRKDARDAFAALLVAALTGVGKPVQAVYSYKRGEFTGAPVILVYGGNTIRSQLGQNPGQSFASSHQLIIDLWVADADEAQGWDEQDVEDTVDTIGKNIADVVGDNRQVEDAWDYLDFENTPSSIFEVTTKGGQSYVVERFYLHADIYD